MSEVWIQRLFIPIWLYPSILVIWLLSAILVGFMHVAVEGDLCLHTHAMTFSIKKISKTYRLCIITRTEAEFELQIAMENILP